MQGRVFVSQYGYLAVLFLVQEFFQGLGGIISK
jgi:hypothetical protein